MTGAAALLDGAPAAPAPPGAAVRAEALRIRRGFEAAGAEVFETGILQPAGPLLDLYGEDIRARAFTTHDPLEGERMLRPDFTVAVARAHLARGVRRGRYAYAGEVFRRQERPGRPSEYIQAGFEVFDERDPAARDAEALALVLDAAAGAPAAVATGDIGLLMGAVQGLRTSERRRAALARHVWRPQRFRALLERFGGPGGRSVPPDAAIAAAGPEIGERAASEVALRLAALRRDASEPPLPAEQVEALGALLSCRGSCAGALGALRPAAEALPTLAPRLDAFARRLDALAARGVEPARLPFEATLGHATMEYYDGFVFTLTVEGRPLASGGRYDALARALGGRRAVPAVGAILRPAELVGRA